MNKRFVYSVVSGSFEKSGEVFAKDMIEAIIAVSSITSPYCKEVKILIEENEKEENES